MGRRNLYLRYTVHWVDWDSSLVPAKIYILDVADTGERINGPRESRGIVGCHLIRDEIQAGKSDKQIYKKLEDEYGETVLYAPKSNVHIMALNPVRGVPLTPEEKETMLDILTPPPSEAAARSWWRRWSGQ